MTTRRRRWDVLLSAALFLLLALLFVPECDDCYFIYWDFASWKDFLLVRPIPQEGVVLGVPSNGRYLGNLLGLILGKLAFSPLWPLRVLILGGGMLGLTLLLSRFFQGGAGRRPGILCPGPLPGGMGPLGHLAAGVQLVCGLGQLSGPHPAPAPPASPAPPGAAGPLAPRPAPLPVHRPVHRAQYRLSGPPLLRYGSGRTGPRPPGPPARPVSPGRPAGRQLGRAGPEHDQLRLRSGGQRPAGGGAGSGPGQPACHLYRGPPPPHSPLPDHQPPAAVAGTAAGLPPLEAVGLPPPPPPPLHRL